MEPLLEKLEERVHAAVELIARLRAEISRLETELAAHSLVETAEPITDGETAALSEEVARLRAERALVRERIGGLIKEIDAVSW